MKRLPGGAFSGYAIKRLVPGDVLEAMTPTGRFFTPLDRGNARHYAAIAVGSGITPILSLAATTLETEPQSRFTLLYGNRTSRSVMFLDDLYDLKNRYMSRFSLLNFLSREPQESGLLSGRIDRARLMRLFATILPPGDVDEWFLCGPFEMVREIRGVLVGSGVPGAHVHTELFHAETLRPAHQAEPEPPAAPADGRSTVTVNLDGRATTFVLAGRTEPILDAVLRLRQDAPYACKGGVCGTCRAKVLEGAVDMDRTYALEQDDIDRGYVLTCQSRPASDTVVLDYDR